MARTVLGRDAEGRLIDIVVYGDNGVIVDQPGGGEHPDLATHTGLGLAPAHAHPYSADDHTHAAGDHPNLATHDALGLVTDADLTTHAGTAHGTQAHAISGVSHTGSLDHSALGSVTANQHHNQAHAIGGADHTGSLTAADVGASPSGHTHAGGSEAFPVGSVFLAVVATDPATMLGYGTWSAFGAGRMLVGLDSGQTEFDTAEETGGAKTHGHTSTQPSDHAALTHSGATVGNHAVTQPSAHTDHAALSHSAHAGATVANHTDVLNHTHPENRNSATTGGLDGWAAGDTSTSTPLQTGYVTGNPSANGVAAQVHTVGQANAHSDHAAQSHSAHAGTAVDAHAVGQASQHAAQSHIGAAVADGSTLPPYIVVHMWKRTA